MGFFKNAGEIAMFFTSLIAGFTMVIGVNAVNSAPSFMLDYYKYVAKDENAVPKHPKFWDNVLTFYTVVTLVAQCVHEPTNLTSFMCRFSLIFRLEMSTILMLIEMLVILILPHSGCSENSAIAALMIMAYIGGMGRAYFENTGYAMFGPCPSKMLSGLLVGAAFSGVLVSAIQITLLAVMSDSYDGAVTQSIIYFSFSIFIILLGGVMLITLLYNPFAKRYIAEFRSRHSVWANIYRPLPSHSQAPAPSGGTVVTSETAPEKEKSPDRECVEPMGVEDDVLFDDRVGHQGVLKQAELSATTGEMERNATSIEDLEGRDMTTSELLQSVPLVPVLKKVWVMMVTCFCTFGLTYLLYPGMLLAVDSDDKWFTTTVMAVYNTSDFLGRFFTLWECLHPSRRTLVWMAISRISMVPLLVLCATHHIPYHALAFIFTSILGIGNGYIGTLTIVFSPFSEGLSSDGECALASQATGVMLLLGCAIGSLIQIGEVVPLG
eukprot:gene4847-3473_t